ncbi:MAG: GntR family transcriptional regulator [Oscillospiraceae bacterium]|nr:GntR family transcriptional regulator [Oscillospiraceae bacterium]MCI8807180.1 GntR family transcriptional regulator [Oscillospiraceae bacterium]MCI9308144.1 GntR family transcriptional regulator [Oscillospiraceae bacterium]MCI9549231.1 GntR family transcriptional regulator [Oscillospiraceae bacterium]
MEQRHSISPRDEALERIKCYIAQNRLAPRTRLPGERELCALWGVNRATLRSAIQRLIKEGRLYSIKGSGTYVAPPKLERSLQDAKSTSESVRSAGFVLQNKVLDVRVLECSRSVSQKLQIPLGRKVFYLSRLRIIDGTPYMLEGCYVNWELCPGLEEHDYTTESLYRVLNSHGVYPVQGEEQVGITYATEEEARHLRLEEGDHLFFRSGVTCDRDGHPVDHFKSVARPDKVRFSTMLHKRTGEDRDI